MPDISKEELEVEIEQKRVELKLLEERAHDKTFPKIIEVFLHEDGIDVLEHYNQKYDLRFSRALLSGLENLLFEVKLTVEVSKDGSVLLLAVNDKKVEQ